MRKKFLKLFFALLYTGTVLLIGALVGADHPGYADVYKYVLVILAVAIVSATIGVVCTIKGNSTPKQNEPKKTAPKKVQPQQKNDSFTDVYSN